MDREEEIMQVPIPGSDLEVVVRRIREISRRMDEMKTGTTETSAGQPMAGVR